MKAKINNIEFEGTPEEFAEFLRLQAAKVERPEKAEYNTDVPRQTEKSCSDNKINRRIALVSVLHNGEPVGTMGMTELASLLGHKRETVRKWLYKKGRIEYKGYTATMISRGRSRRSVRLKATDTKGDNRIYNSIIDFCSKTNISVDRFGRLRLKQPKGPWQINGYTVEQIF